MKFIGRTVRSTGSLGLEHEPTHVVAIAVSSDHKKARRQVVQLDRIRLITNPSLRVEYRPEQAAHL